MEKALQFITIHCSNYFSAKLKICPFDFEHIHPETSVKVRYIAGVRIPSFAEKDSSDSFIHGMMFFICKSECMRKLPDTFDSFGVK